MSKKQGQPVVLVIAGPNGAGKSTCAAGILGNMLRGLPFINADDIAHDLSSTHPEKVRVQAGRLMIDRIRSLTEQKASFAFETTLAGHTHL